MSSLCWMAAVNAKTRLQNAHADPDRGVATVAFEVELASLSSDAGRRITQRRSSASFRHWSTCPAGVRARLEAV